MSDRQAKAQQARRRTAVYRVVGGAAMSRIGKQPVRPRRRQGARRRRQGVRRRPQGAKLEQAFHRNMNVEFDENAKAIKVTRPDDDRQNRALHGLTRSLIANMVEGVTKGYETTLKIEGIGYQARMDKKAVVLTVGYANAVKLTPPEGVTVELPDATTIVVKGRTSRRSASSRRRSATSGRRNRTRARASATRTSRSGARKASPSPAAADRGDHESPEVQTHSPAAPPQPRAGAASPARRSGRA